MQRNIQHASTDQLFQSAPARESGRCGRFEAAIAVVACFNPRPLVRAGDAVTRADPRRAQRSFQSAPARESGRCKDLARVGAQLLEFQSAPARESGRCDGDALGIDQFSEFQSAPARESGRCAALLQLDPEDRKFQSAPARESGRCRVQIIKGEGHACFNPRPLVRAGDACSRSALANTFTPLFQSAPARESGRCRQGLAHEFHHLRVSIRARS